jgi:hypothetical protein
MIVTLCFNIYGSKESDTMLSCAEQKPLVWWWRCLTFGSSTLLIFFRWNLPNSNKKENKSYIGPILPVPYYSPNRMNPRDKDTFMAWHQGMRDWLCVQLSRRNFTVFSIGRLHSSLSPPVILCIVPPQRLDCGYCADGIFTKNKQSLLAHKWSSYTAKKNETYIQHACNGREKRVIPYLLDGYHKESNMVEY